MTRRLAPAVLVVAALLVTWQVAVTLTGARPQVLPSPLRVLEQGWAFRSALWENALPTIQVTVIGFAVSLTVAWGIAIAVDFSPWLRRAVTPLLVASQTLPVVAIAPLLIIWFGRGAVPIVVCSFLIAVFPIIVDVAHGLTSVDEDLVNVLKLANASELSILAQVRIPNALPYLFSSFRVAAPGAVIGTLLGEFIGSREGLGYLITVYSAQLNTAAVFVLALLSCLVGIVFFNACLLVERLAVPWKSVVR